MNKLALTVPGNIQVQIPSDIARIDSGNFGAHIIQTAFNILFLGSAILALAFMIFGGFKWIISQGDSKNIEGARNTIIYSAVGLIVVFLSYFVVNVIGKFLGVPLLGP